MACKGGCSKYTAPNVVDHKRYAIGQKRCTTCSKYLNWEGIHCPCCGMQLRLKPRKRIKMILARIA